MAGKLSQICNSARVEPRTKSGIEYDSAGIHRFSFPERVYECIIQVDRMKFGQFSDEQSFDSPEEIVVQLDLSSSLERNVVELSPQRVCKSVDRFVVENRNSE